MKSALSEALTVGVELGKPFAQASGPMLEEIKRRVYDRLDETCRRLRIEPTPKTRVKLSSHDEPLRVSFAGCVRRTDLRAVGRTVAYFDPDSKSETDPWKRFSDLISSLCDPELEDSHSRLLDGILALIGLTIDKYANELFGSEQAQRFLEATEASQSRAITQREAEILSEIVRDLMKLGTSIPDRNRLLEVAGDAIRRRRDPAEICEMLVPELRQRDVQVEVTEGAFQTITGLGRLQPVSVFDPSVARRLREPFKLMIEGMHYELGVYIPDIRITASKALADGCFHVVLDNTGVQPHRGLSAAEILVDKTPDELKTLNIESVPVRNPANGKLCAVTTTQHADTINGFGLTSWDTVGFIVLSVAAQIREHAWLFMDRDVAEFALSKLRQAFPDLVDVALSVIPSWLLARILRRLLREQVSVRDLRQILEALLPDVLRIASQTPQLRARAEAHSENVRRRLTAYLTNKYSKGGSKLQAFHLVEDLKEEVREIVASDPSKGTRVSVTENEARRERLRAAAYATAVSTGSDEFVIVVDTELRLPLRDLLADEFPHIAVLAVDEVEIEKIEWADEIGHAGSSKRRRKKQKRKTRGNSRRNKATP